MQKSKDLVAEIHYMGLFLCKKQQYWFGISVGIKILPYVKGDLKKQTNFCDQFLFLLCTWAEKTYLISGHDRRL